jgi:hypothetical protein
VRGWEGIRLFTNAPEDYFRFSAISRKGAVSIRAALIPRLAKGDFRR